MQTGIRPLLAGNWKMNGDSDSLGELTRIVSGFDAASGGTCDGLICVPATLVSRAAATAEGASVAIGGQDCHFDQSGAFTGDVSASMLQDAGASHVIVGHSERRSGHGESNADVCAKTKAAWNSGLIAVICIGETLAQRSNNETLEILAWQIAESVPEGSNARTTVIAYEPVWAIGTGQTPSKVDIAKAHEHIRSQLRKKAGDEQAEAMRLLYGGSVKPDNAAGLMALDHVDGALVGGASLKSSDFLQIAAAFAG